MKPKIKGLKKAEPGRNSPCLLINGELVKYVKNMETGSYALVRFPTNIPLDVVFVSGDTVFGSVRDAYGECREFQMPLGLFEQLETVADSRDQESAS